MRCFLSFGNLSDARSPNMSNTSNQWRLFICTGGAKRSQWGFTVCVVVWLTHALAYIASGLVPHTHTSPALCSSPDLYNQRATCSLVISANISAARCALRCPDEFPATFLFSLLGIELLNLFLLLSLLTGERKRFRRQVNNGELAGQSEFPSFALAQVWITISNRTGNLPLSLPIPHVSRFTGFHQRK